VEEIYIDEEGRCDGGASAGRRFGYLRTRRELIAAHKR